MKGELKMKQALQNLANSKNGPFFICVSGILILYGIQRITETSYQFSASTKDGEIISLKPSSSTVENLIPEQIRKDMAEGGEN